MDSFFVSLINATGWTLIHSLWQAALIFVILKLLLAVFRQMPSQFKYFLSLAALSGITLCVMITFSNQWQHQQATLTWLTKASVIPPMTQAAMNSPVITGPDKMGTPSLLQIVDMAYLIGLVFFLVRFARDLSALVILRRSRKAPFADAWENYLEKLSAHWGISQHVRLFLSEHIDVPVVIGYLKPIIYLPFSMANNLASEHIEAILLHELAHIKRNDFLINIFQTAIETMLFFNPFVWFISKMIRRERENSCDDMVMKYLQPRLYAEALVAISENVLLDGKKTLSGGQLTMAAADNKQELFYRVKRMMENRTKKLNVMQKLLILVVLFGGIISIAWLSPEKRVEKPKVKAVAFSNGNSQRLSPIDTALPAPPPPPPSVSAPAPPPPPTMSTPPPPPPPPPVPNIDSAEGGNTFTFNRNDGYDSAYTNQWEKQMNKYYSSQGWKDYQKSLKKYVQKINEQVNNGEWQAYQKQMAGYAHAMAEKYSSPQWKKYQQDLSDWAQKVAAKQADYFKSDAWQHQLDSLNKKIVFLASNRAQIDSVRAVDQANRSIAFVHPDFNKVAFSSNGQNVNVQHLVNEMRSDGLLQNKNDYTIRINRKGLYIDGKKQDERYYEKYQNRIGKNTVLEIKKHNDSFKSSISSK